MLIKKDSDKEKIKCILNFLVNLRIITGPEKTPNEPKRIEISTKFHLIFPRRGRKTESPDG